MRGRLGIAAIVTVLVLLTGAFPTAADSSPMLSRQDAGFANGAPNRDPKIFGAELDATKAAGATWYRGDLVSVHQADAIVPQVKARA